MPSLSLFQPNVNEYPSSQGMAPVMGKGFEEMETPEHFGGSVVKPFRTVRWIVMVDGVDGGGDGEGEMVALPWIAKMPVAWEGVR